jgi:hypothetical protein
MRLRMSAPMMKAGSARRATKAHAATTQSTASGSRRGRYRQYFRRSRLVKLPRADRELGEDLTTWRDRQAQLGLRPFPLADARDGRQLDGQTVRRSQRPAATSAGAPNHGRRAKRNRVVSAVS